MAAITPVKPDFYDVTSIGKVRVWMAPTISVAATGDTITVPGIKQVFTVSNARTGGVVGWTSSADGLGNSVITLVVTASSTGGSFPLVVYGQ